MHESFNEKHEYISEKYIWKNELKDEYINRLSHESTKVQLELLDSKRSHCSNGIEVQYCVTDLVNLLDEVAAPLFKKTIKHDDVEILFNQEKDNPWYNNECRKKKYFFMHMLDKYRESKADENRVNKVRAGSEYKNVLRRCKYEFDRKTQTRLLLQKIRTPNNTGIC